MVTRHFSKSSIIVCTYKYKFCLFRPIFVLIAKKSIQQNSYELKSWILKLCLFATGLSGIVAEYVLSTLATYFLGDSVFQWTMIVSIMLFSMGLGSKITKYIENNLMERFVLIEFTLSILTAFVSLFAYTAATYSIYTGAVVLA